MGIEKIRNFSEKEIMTLQATNTYQATVKRKFKNFSLSNQYKMVIYAHKGIKPEVFYDFAQVINMSEKNLARIINISARTISNYKEQQKVLEPIQSEHLLKLIALFDKGEEIFGNISEFNYWLEKPFWNTKEKPLDLLITPGGIELVMEEVDKMAQGYPV